MTDATEVLRYHAEDDAMSPRHRLGDTVLASRTLPPLPGCDVLVQMPGDRWTLREVAAIDAEGMLVRTLTPDAEYRLAGDNVLAVYRVLTTNELSGWPSPHIAA